MDEHVGRISDSIKQVDSSNYPIKETHIVDRVCDLSVEVVSHEPAIIGIKTIRQGITQGIINRSTNIGSNLVTNVLTNSSEQLFNTDSSLLNTLQYEGFVIGQQDERVESNRMII